MITCVSEGDANLGGNLILIRYSRTGNGGEDPDSLAGPAEACCGAS